MNVYPELLKRKLFNITKKMSEKPEPFVNQPGKDFTRNRKLDFFNLHLFLLGAYSKSLRMELYEKFGFKASTISPSALCQQRAKLNGSSFEHLFKEFTTSATKDKLYKGYRLLAADGSELNIHHDQNNPDTYVRHTNNQKGYSALHLNGLYDLRARTYVDALVQHGKRKNETRALCTMVDRSAIMNPNTIIIADRAYEAYNVLAHVTEKGCKYLIRAKDVNSNGIARNLSLPASDEFDTTRTLQLTRNYSEEMKQKLPHYKTINPNTFFDFLDESNVVYTLKFRVVRFKTSDDNYQLMLTNLDEKEFSAEEISKLYQMRWGIETSFRELKYAMGLTAFHSRKTAFIIQEIYARLTLYNFCEMIITNCVINQNNTKHVYQINFTVAIDLCRRFFCNSNNEEPPDIEALIQINRLPIREGRKFQRSVRRGRVISFNYRLS